MNPWWDGLGLLAAMVSALALYAASRHGRWPLARGRRRGLCAAAGMLAALLSLLAWSLALGAVVGTCAMLGTWMLSMVALPWLGLLAGAPRVEPGGNG